MTVVINYKICDLAPECGGMTVCPTGAFFWNKKTRRPDVDNKKCISCGRCDLECPVGAIMVARTPEEYRKLLEKVRNDPHCEKDLWRERLGCQPGRTSPKAIVITPKNINRILRKKGWTALDVWTKGTLDCRFHSALWKDLGFGEKIALCKLDGEKYPELARKLGVTSFPTLVFLKDGKERGRWEGYIYPQDMTSVRDRITQWFAKT